MQSNDYHFSSINDLHQSGKRVGILANCEILIHLFLFWCRITFVYVMKGDSTLLRAWHWTELSE